MFKPEQNYYLHFLLYISHFLETFLKCFYKDITIKFKYNIGKTSGINCDSQKTTQQFHFDLQLFCKCIIDIQ